MDLYGGLIVAIIEFRWSLASEEDKGYNRPFDPKSSVLSIRTNPEETNIP